MLECSLLSLMPTQEQLRMSGPAGTTAAAAELAVAPRLVAQLEAQVRAWMPACVCACVFVCVCVSGL